jgi:hypothetical protein
MSKQEASLTNYNSQILIDKIHDQSSTLSPPIFVLCDECYWCATYFDKTRIPLDNTCPHCGTNNSELSSFPIMSNEAFPFDYKCKRGVELEFRPRPKRS